VLRPQFQEIGDGQRHPEAKTRRGGGLVIEEVSLIPQDEANTVTNEIRNKSGNRSDVLLQSVVDNSKIIILTQTKNGKYKQCRVYEHTFCLLQCK
jgi:hypothetical protein